MPAPRDNRLVGGLIVVTVAATAIANLSGLGISDDGVAYRAIADSLDAGEGLGYFLEPELTTWPPLFPLLMAGIMWCTPIGAEGAAILLNVLTAAVIVAGTDALVRRTIRSSEVRTAVTVAVAVGAPTVLFAHLLTTDFAMAAAVIWMTVALMDFRRTGRTTALAGAVMALWIGFGLRYAMFALIPIAAVWVGIQTHLPLRRRLVAAVGTGVAGALVPVIWALRNHEVDGTYLGDRWSSNRGVLGNAIDLGGAVGNLVAPGLAIDLRLVWFGVAALVITLGLILGLRVLLDDERSRSIRGIVSLAATNTGLLVLVSGGYLTYLLLARTLTAFDRLNFRFVYPVAIPMIVVAAVAIDRLLRREPATPWATAARATLVGGVVTTCALGIAMIAWFATGPDLFDGNYERDLYASVRADDALDALEGCSVFSNSPSALYPALEAEWAPRATAHFSADTLDELDDFVAQAAAEPTCLVWVDAEPEFANVIPREELRDSVALTDLASTDVLTIYSVTP